MASSLPTPPSSPVPACLDIRDRLKDLETPEESNVPQHKRFFPERSIRRFFTRGIVKTLLECCCSKCHSHRFRQQITDPASYVSNVLDGHSRDRHRDAGVVILLALLVYIECPALIYTFIRGHCGDEQFKAQTSKFTHEYVQETFWHMFPTKYARNFHWERYKFAIPRIEGDHYEEYPSSVILPFVNEKRIGRTTGNGEIISEGSYGDVYSFDILDGYCNFPQQRRPGVPTFARKELRGNTPYSRFCAERDNLFLVKMLQDKHLIKIVKSYRHGDVYNFIFPCARANLHWFLREQPFRPFSDFTGAVLEHPIWEQMLGLARGLHKVIDCEIPDTRLENSLYGYHFDLKPANILVEWSGDLVITDFGQAIFKKAAGTSSKVTGMGGTEAYAPPEIDKDQMVNNRRYDIWSLGCILLEVSTFVVKGRSGLLELDSIRSRPDTEAHTCDDRFFRRALASVLKQPTPEIHRSETYEIKPQIYHWIQHLPEFVPEGPSRHFINKILSLALQMLSVDIYKRLTSKEVCLSLSDIISQHQIYHNQPEHDPRVIPNRPSEGFDIGTELMAKVPQISYNLEGYWDSAPLHFVQDSTLLCVQTFEDKKWVRRSLGHWSQLKLIPQYAMLDRGNHYFSEATLYLAPNNMSESSLRRHGKFWTPANALILQEILLAQEVHRDIKLKTAAVELKQVRSLLKLMHRKRSSGRSSDAPLSMEVDAHSVQLWMESSRRDIIGPDAAARRQLPRSLRLGPGTRRIVVFYEKSILILRVAKNERIEPRDNSNLSSTSITIVPTDRATDPSFPVSVLRPKSSELLPGFSLSKDGFEAQEMENRIECSSLTLDFVSREDADSFQRTYKKLKKQWAEQLKAFESLQNHIGGEIGYFQST